MKLRITVIVLCLVPIVWGQILNQGDGTLQVQGKAILDLQLRLSAVERLHNKDALRNDDLSKHQNELSKQQEINQRRIADLEKQQQIDHSRIADLEKKRHDDHVRIADLEKKRQDDQKRIVNLVKQQRFYIGRIADLEKNLGDDDQRHMTYPQKQQHRRRLDSHQKFPPDSFTNSTSRKTDVRRVPSVRKTKSFGPNSSDSELRSPSLETMSANQGIKKRVSPDNELMVAFYAVLSHAINPVADLTEIYFDRVITDIGGSYSGNTGTFTCIHKGVYVFSWTVHVRPLYMYTELVKNGVMIGSAFSGNSQYDGIGGGTVIVELNQGDEVWVRVIKHNPGSYIYFDKPTTTFSGFLL